MAPQFLDVLVVVLLIPCYKTQVPDNRCFLESGGSTENFFVSEDLPVGSVIGSVRIIGDPSEHSGNIVLRLKELDSPVIIAPGTKNITLTQKLDKEGVEGPASVYVNIICDRIRTGDPPFVIPVNIRVTDVNDNAPQFINAPYVLNISEVTVVGTRVLQGIRAVDADQRGAYSTVQYSVLPGKNAEYFVFVNGLEGTLLLRKPLDYELLTNFTITIRAQDQGTPPQYSDTTLYVNVIDADDQNPKFFDDRYSAILPERPLQGTRLRIEPREITAYDQDLGIRAEIYYTFNSGGHDYKFFDIDRTDGHVLIKRSVPDDELLQPATLVVRATQVDNQDRYALATLTVSRSGISNSVLQFLQRSYSAAVLESVPVHSVLLTVVTNKPRDRRIRYWLENPEKNERFSVTPAGDIELQQPLDYELEDFYTFLVHASDGRVNDTARVNITVLNVNDWDPRFRYPQYEFFVNNPNVREGDVVGKVEAADGDRGDYVTLTLRGPAARMFEVTENGDIVLVDMSLLNSSTAHVVVVATDNGIPPRQASAPVIVHFPEALVRVAGSSWAPGGTSFLLMVVFGALLGILGLVIFLLVLYIYKHKKPKSSHQSSPKKTGYIHHEKKASSGGGSGGAGKVSNPVYGNGANQDSNVNPQYTATVKSIIARNSCNNPMAISTKHKIAPAPPQLPPESSRAATPSENNNQQQGKGNVNWPSGSIPRRVKKLSWDDEGSDSKQLEPEHPNTGPHHQEEQTNDQMNLTVYF